MLTFHRPSIVAAACFLVVSLPYLAIAQQGPSQSGAENQWAVAAPVAVVPQSPPGDPSAEVLKPPSRPKLVVQGLLLGSPKLGFGVGADLEVRLWRGLHAGVAGFGSVGGAIGFWLNGALGLRTSYRMDFGSLVVAPWLSIYSFSGGTRDNEEGTVIAGGVAPSGGLQILNRMVGRFLLGVEVGVIGVGYVVRDGIYVANPKPDEHHYDWCPYGALVLGGNF